MAQGATFPAFPAGSGMLLLGLVGTTVVPYNLFLGSGIADTKQRLSEMRWGVAVAVVLGGIISMAVLVTGTAVDGPFSFLALGHVLGDKMGRAAVWLFGFGLFAAGFSSAVTAPLASAITARDIFGKPDEKRWQTGGRYYRLTWMFVLFTGLGFGMAGFKPVPAIIAAQALNGLILPFVTVFLWMAVNDKALVGESVNALWSNVLFGIVVWVSLLLGSWNIWRTLAGAAKGGVAGFNTVTGLLSGLSLVLTAIVWVWVVKKRRR